MNAPELQALRRLLFFSVAEAARYLAADDQRPGGVEERTWNRWEAGKVPVPASIAKRIGQALDFRASLIREHLAHIAAATTAEGKRVLLWYPEVDDWAQPPMLWRPAMSAAAHVLAAEPGRCVLVGFDGIEYHSWLRKLRRGDAPPPLDSTSMRDVWASIVAARPEPGQ